MKRPHRIKSATGLAKIQAAATVCWRQFRCRITCITWACLSAACVAAPLHLALVLEHLDLGLAPLVVVRLALVEILVLAPLVVVRLALVEILDRVPLVAGRALGPPRLLRCSDVVPFSNLSVL
jgi:hypothetical protein